VLLKDRFAQLAGRFLNGVLGNAHNSGGGPNGTAVNQAADNRTAFFVGSCVHVLIMLDRSRMPTLNYRFGKGFLDIGLEISLPIW